MDCTITTSAAISALAAAAILAYFGYRTQKHTRKTDGLERELERRKRADQCIPPISGYDQLEEKYSEQVASMTGQAQRTVKSEFRDAVQQEGFNRPKWTTLERDKAIDDLI
jgi:hypothetical protein